MTIVCHRGFWWPNRRMQNHPSVLNAALKHGWDIEVDVWRTHGSALKVGHDRPNYEWSLPSPDIGPGRLFVHLKGPSTNGYTWSADMRERITALLQKAGWEERSSMFISPAVHRSQMQVITAREQIDSIASHAHSVWVEQPYEDWVDDEDIGNIRSHGVPAYVLSSELHGRQVNLKNIEQWKDADGIVTDMPHLFERILDKHDLIVHPQEAWW